MKSRSIDFLFLSSFVFLGAGIFMIYNFYHRYDRSNNLVDHSYEVQNKILDIESEFRSMLASQRSYLLSEDRAYLSKYNNRKNTLNKLTNELDSLVAYNPIQLENLKSLRKNLDIRIASLNEELTLMEKAFFSAKLIRKHIIASSNDSEKFIEEIKNMNALESQLMKTRVANQIDGEEKIPLIFTLVAFLSISVIAFTYFKLKTVLNEKVNLLLHKRRLVQRVTKSNEELQHYAYVTSHDLQEPLRKISIFADLSNEALINNDKEKLEKYLNKIDASSRNAIDLAKRLMNHAQLNEEEHELVKVRPSDIFSEIASQLKILNEAEVNIEYSAQETPELPLYPKRVEMLFRNIISNAIKFRKENEPILSIDLTYDTLKNEFHRITITDNGHGFDPKYAENVFELFNDLKLHHNSSKKSFGLNACQKIMESHLGEISAESTPGVGTKIICLFPIQP
ncbi:CHASE3 domain-containing protein [uncultured Arcticibacterium sp.]|uniref:sensor histidine kinase n=1 Tax=uncultured Arcticibacterium sp. TaxID=2173042 RepID=UPI0030FB083D